MCVFLIGAANGVKKQADSSGYQDPCDAYFWVWPKGKGEPTTGSGDSGVSSAYQQPLDRLTREEAIQKIKSQCMPRRSIRRSASHSPPQVASNKVAPERPPLPIVFTSGKKTEEASVSLQTTLRRTDISLNRSERLQASLYVCGNDEDAEQWLEGGEIEGERRLSDDHNGSALSTSPKKNSSLRRSRSLDDDLPITADSNCLDVLPRARKRSSALSQGRSDSASGSPMLVRKRNAPTRDAAGGDGH